MKQAAPAKAGRSLQTRQAWALRSSCWRGAASALPSWVRATIYARALRQISAPPPPPPACEGGIFSSSLARGSCS